MPACPTAPLPFRLQRVFWVPPHAPNQELFPDDTIFDERGAWEGGVEQWCHRGTDGLQASACSVMERGSQMERLCRLSSEEAPAHLSCQTRSHRERFLPITYPMLRAPRTLG